LLSDVNSVQFVERFQKKIFSRSRNVTRGHTWTKVGEQCCQISLWKHHKYDVFHIVSPAGLLE